MDSGEGKFPQHSLKIKNFWNKEERGGGVPVAPAALLTIAFVALAAAIIAANPTNPFGWALFTGALFLLSVIVRGEMKGRR